MGKFGFGKKGGSDGDDGNRLALFGSRSKNKSPAPSSNPYAKPPLSDAYSQPPPYKAPPPAYGGGPQQNDMQKPPYDAPDKKSGGMHVAFAPSKQGDQGGYGRDRFGGSGGGGGAGAGGGGYGGLGRVDPNDPNAADQDRDALFGDARNRVQDRADTSSAPPSYNTHSPENRQAPGGMPAGGAPNYGPYQDRNLTAEEEEEEDVQAMKQEMRFMKQQDVSSTRNALRAAAQAEETGRDTLSRLGAQGERIHNTEKNLDLSANQNRLAEERARELKRLNKSMFAMKVNNPFTGEQRRRARDDAIIDRHQEERLQREETRLAAFRTDQRMDQTFKGLNKQQSNAPQKKTSLAERSKYQFEQDSEDDEMENEIESNLTALHGAAGRLNALSKATGKEIDSQDPHLKRILGKSDLVDDQIHMNRERLNRIH